VNLVQIVSLINDLNFPAHSCNPQVVTLRGHEVWFQPDDLARMRRFSCEVKKFALEVTLEGDVNQALAVILVKWIVSFIVLLLIIRVATIKIELL
jgi:hypothetical protein